MSSIEAIINRQLLRWELERRSARQEASHVEPAPAHIVTVSRQAGSRGSYFATLLAQRLGFQRVHREIIVAISQSSGHYRRLVASLDDHVRGNLELAVESMLTGESMDARDYVRHLYRVVLSMASLGGVVLLGRGGNFILGPNRGYHIRVVCPEAIRVQNLIKYKSMAEKEARAHTQRLHAERNQFVERLFHASIDDPVYYDLVINTGLAEMEDLVDLAERGYRAKMRLLAAKAD